MSAAEPVFVRVYQTARQVAGACLLAAQLGMFARARFVETRYFCWAPFHSEARYTIDATVAGRALSDEDISLRYGLGQQYWDPRTRSNWELNSILHVLELIGATESSLPAAVRAEVAVTYRVNGGELRRWHSP